VGPSKTSARALRKLERQRQAVDLRTRGKTYREIGRELGVTHTAAHKLVAAAMEQTKADIAERGDDLRALWAERLESMARAILPAALDGDLAAHDRVVRIADRFSRLTGLDMQVDRETGDKANIFVTDVETAMRLAGKDPDTIEDAEWEPAGELPASAGSAS
jgi:hypothetical protein